VLVGLQLRPGPDSLLDGLAGQRRVFARTAREGINTLGEAVRLTAVAATSAEAASVVPLGGRAPALNGVFVAVPTPTDASSRSGWLAANSQALALWYEGARQPRQLEAARRLAIAWRLVTPLSGAVVLETREQYRQYELSDAAPERPIPSVPEPTVPAMLAVAGGMAALAALWQRRFWQRGG